LVNFYELKGHSRLFHFIVKWCLLFYSFDLLLFLQTHTPKANPAKTIIIGHRLTKFKNAFITEDQPWRIDFLNLSENSLDLSCLGIKSFLSLKVFLLIGNTTFQVYVFFSYINGLYFFIQYLISAILYAIH